MRGRLDLASVGIADELERRTIALAGIALVVIGLVVLVSGAPVAWWLLGFCAVASLAVLVPATIRNRLLEPLPIVMGVALLSFVARPLQLFSSPLDLLSWHNPHSSINGLLRLDTQELALFVTTKIRDPLEPMLTRATAAAALFFACLLIGYSLPFGRELGRRLTGSGLGSRTVKPAVVAGCLIVGLVGQIAVLVKVGGPVEAANTMIEQKALNAGLALHVLAGFGLVGIVLWAAWRRPSGGREWAAFGLAAFEVCAFYTVSGSRTRVFLLLLMLVVVVHYRWRRWRLRELAIAGLIVLVFSSALLGVRQATADKPIGEALASAPKYIADPRGVLNDITEYDGLFEATAIYGPHRSYRYGEGLLDAFHSYVPGAIDPNKPESGDIVFRKLIWGKTLKGGRPYTLIGDFYVDFGFPGIAVGALLFGILLRGLLGLAARSREEGGAYRVSLFALSIAIIYMAVVTTYAVALGFIVTLVLPFLVATHLLGSPVRPTAALAGESR